MRWPGWAAELRASLELFAPLFASRQKVEKTEAERMLLKEEPLGLKKRLINKKGWKWKDRIF